MALVTLASCDAGPPRECSVASQQAFQCMSRFDSGHVREMLLACFPFSKPEKIEGTWFYGFELNAFYEGATAPKVYSGLPGPVETTLEYDPNLPVDGKVRVLQMQLIGRRSQCEMAPAENIIVVDRVVSSDMVAVAN